MSEQQLGYLELRLIQAGENLSGIDREQEGGGQCLPVSLCSCSQPDTMLRDTGTALPPTAQPTLTHTHTHTGRPKLACLHADGQRGGEFPRHGASARLMGQKGLSLEGPYACSRNAACVA